MAAASLVVGESRGRNRYKSIERLLTSPLTCAGIARCTSHVQQGRDRFYLFHTIAIAAIPLRAWRLVGLGWNPRTPRHHPRRPGWRPRRGGGGVPHSRSHLRLDLAWDLAAAAVPVLAFVAAASASVAPAVAAS